METLIQAVKIYSEDIGMEFGTEKCAILIMGSGKRHRTKGTEVLNKDKIRTLGEKEIYKYLRIWEAGTIKHAEIKEKKIKKN